MYVCPTDLGKLSHILHITLNFLQNEFVTITYITENIK